MSIRKHETIEYIFALGIYYRYIIAPITKTGEFFDRIRKNDIGGISVGGKNVGYEFQISIRKAKKHFNIIMGKYGLNETFFSLTDVKQIVMELIKLDERMIDEE
jgi:hypothetical protein